jgi:hypothetical protein
MWRDPPIIMLCNRFNAHGYGIDISPIAIEQSQQYKNITTVLAAAILMPFPEDYFDFLIVLDYSNTLKI